MTTQTNVSAEGTKGLRKVEERTVTAAVGSAVKAAGRMLFVDNLRVVLTIQVILLHMAITYGGEGSWFYRERPTTEMAGILLTLFNLWNQFYFMGLFFLISGYFVPGSVDRKGSLRFIKDRLLRLGIPLVLFSTLVSPITEFSKGLSEGWFEGSFPEFVVHYYQRGDFATGPLWFVEILLVFSAIYAISRGVLQKLNSGQKKKETRLSPKGLTHRHILLFILVLAPLNFVVRLASQIGEEWAHIQLAFIPQYAMMFAVGILAYRREWLPEIPARVRKTWGIVAILAFLTLPVVMIAGGAIESVEPFLGGLTIQSLVLSGWEAVYSISMSILMLTLFRSRLDFQGSFGRFLSKNAYAVYIIHAPLIVGVARLFQGVSLDPLLKFALISPIAISVCFLVSHFLVRRIPQADKVL